MVVDFAVVGGGFGRLNGVVSWRSARSKQSEMALILEVCFEGQSLNKSIQYYRRPPGLHRSSILVE